MDKQQQFNELFGSESQFSDHKTGDTIRFMDGGTEKTGKIVHVMPPGETVGGIAHGVRYVVEVNQKGFPSIVAPGDVLS